jgi:hypothetical protein
MAAQIARFSIRLPSSPVFAISPAVADHSRPPATDGSERCASRSAILRAAARAHSKPAAHIPSSWARSGIPPVAAGAAAIDNRARERRRPGPRRRSRLIPGRARHGGDRTPHITHQVVEGPAQCSRPRHEHHRGLVGQRRAMAPVSFSQPASRAVTARRAPHLSTDGKAHLDSSVPDAPEQDEAWLFFPLALLENRLDVTCVPKSFVAREGQRCAAVAGHAARRRDACVPSRAAV